MGYYKDIFLISGIEHNFQVTKNCRITTCNLLESKLKRLRTES